MFDEVQTGIADLYASWDPIGVYRGKSPFKGNTEYDDLVIPTVRLLAADITADDLAGEIHEVLAVDYGFESVPKTKKIAKKILKYWQTRPESSRL